jgi:DNA replication protein DnaC
LLCEARLSDFAQPIIVAARSWLQQPTTHGLFLTGATGTSKTWLAAAMVRTLVEAGRRVGFRCAADFYADLRATINDADVAELTILSQATEPEFFVLDDVGAGGLTDFERRSTLHLLEHRLNYLRPTIVTSNLSVEQIALVMDERIASRLAGFTRMAMTGRDRRERS